MPSKKVWANILFGAAVMERPDFIIEKENSSIQIKKIKDWKIMTKESFIKTGKTTIYLNFVFKKIGLSKNIIIGLLMRKTR